MQRDLSSQIRVAQVHAGIRVEIQAFRDNMEDTDEFWDRHTDAMDAIGQVFNLDPQTRDKEDLIRAIAYLEFIAGQLQDEIGDGAYNPG